MKDSKPIENYAPDNSSRCSHTQSRQVFGRQVLYRSNNAQVISRLQACFGNWGSLPESMVRNDGELQADIVVLDTRCRPPPTSYDFSYDLDDSEFKAEYLDNRIYVDRSSGRAIAHVTLDLFENGPAFDWFVLEPLTYMLVNASRVPFHASAVARGNHAVALIGRSGAGKSSLAFACVRLGASLLAEDVVYVGVGDDRHVWGHANRIHLLPDSTALFPDLAGQQPKARPNGKSAITVLLGNSDRYRAALYADCITACVLYPDHANARSSIVPLQRTRVRNMLTGSEPVYELETKNFPEALDRLLERQPYLLRVGSDIGSAAGLVMDLLAGEQGRPD